MTDKGCLSHADLAVLLDGSAPSRDEDSAHLGQCRDCQAAIESLIQVPALDGRLSEWAIAERHRFAPTCAADTSLPAGLIGVGTVVASPHDSAVPGGFETVSPTGLPAGPGTRMLGKYRLVRLLGEGGMGRVWMAEDTKLGRQVALKEVRPDYASNPAIRERFLREARLLASIRHDHVVVIHDQDEADGELYLVMELLDGEPLDALISRAGPLPVAEAVRIVREAALGLARLHEAGLVHRDVKPANLFLEAPRARVKLLDLGLARPAECDAGFTRSGVSVGTPNYMSPEQAEGKPVDARTDLFGLGCVLHHALTGKTPFKGETPMMVMSSVLRDDPVPVASLRADTPPALADLVRRMLAKASSGRPASARDVVEALDAVLQALAVPPRPWWRWVAAAILVVAIVAAGVMVLTLPGPGGGTVSIETDDDDIKVEVTKAGRVVTILDRKGRQSATITAGTYEVVLRNDGGKFTLDAPDFTLKRGGVVVVRVIRWTGKGMGLATGKKPFLSDLDLLNPANIPDKERRVWHPKELVAVLGSSFEKEKQRVYSLAFSPTGSDLLSGGEDGHVRWWDVVKGREVLSFEGRAEHGLQAALSPNGTTALSGGAQQPIRLWDLVRNKEITSFVRPGYEKGKDWENEVVHYSPVFLPSGKQALIIHRDGAGNGPSTVRLWDLETRRVVREFKHDVHVWGLALSPDGKQFLAPIAEGVLRLWDVAGGSKAIPALVLPPHYKIDLVAWSPDGKHVLTGDHAQPGHPDVKAGKALHAIKTWVWKGDELQLVARYSDVEAEPYAVAWAAEGKRFAYADKAGKLIVRDFPSGEKVGSWLLPKGVLSLAFAPDGRHLAVGTYHGAILILRLPAKAK